MNNFNKKSLIILGFSILILLFGRYIYVHWPEFSQLRVVSPIYIIALIILTILFSLSYGIVIKYLLSAFKIKLKFKEYFGLSIITGFYNMIAPLTGGVVPRALYLKKKYNFKYSLFISSLSGMYVTHFFAGSFLGMISLFLIKRSQNIFNWPIFIVFLSIFILTSVLIVFSPRPKESKIKWINPLIHTINGWHTIRKDTKIIVMATLMSFAQNLINMLGILLAFDVFGIRITLVQAFFLSCTAIIGGFMITTPGIIGLSEIIAVFASLLIGITVPQALSVALLGRAVSTLTILVLGPIYSGVLLNHMRKPKKTN
jgi:uncharacterized membrane protein YbhN (UPF0104 family)